ncbi:MAG: hypothetical protein JSS81_03235 [Acidobacteria bacterium]|nr:hypothetical protein [Acidobacteriota bacterium]
MGDHRAQLLIDKKGRGKFYSPSASFVFGGAAIGGGLRRAEDGVIRFRVALVMACPTAAESFPSFGRRGRPSSARHSPFRRPDRWFGIYLYKKDGCRFENAASQRSLPAQRDGGKRKIFFLSSFWFFGSFAGIMVL